MNRILVTGAAGYIGTVVCEHLLLQRFEVVGTDALRFGPRPLLQLIRQSNFSFLQADLTREAEVTELIRSAHPDAVVHLAAIVGDPACKAEPELARALNIDGTKRLFLRSADAGVRRFVFSSTCSNYGLNSNDELLTENSPLNPVSLYAETKVTVERWLTEQQAPDTSRVILRFSTAHGLSQRMRFDLTVNEFAKALADGRPLEVYDADTWRPYCHVKDFAVVITSLLGTEDIGGVVNVFNVGFDSENYRKRDLVAKIGAAIGGAPDVRYVSDGKDRRNYRVSFAKLARYISLRPTATVDTAAQEIATAVRLGVFGTEEARYANV
jgi:nucleoside-diphosphate-sugar epimerase